MKCFERHFGVANLRPLANSFVAEGNNITNTTEKGERGVCVRIKPGRHDERHGVDTVWDYCLPIRRIRGLQR